MSVIATGDTITVTLTGTQGLPGPQGLTGPQGPIGPQGYPGGSALWTAVGNRVVAASAAETSLLASSAIGSSSLPVGDIEAGSTYAVRASGFLSTGAGQSATVRIKLGASTIVASTVAMVNNMSQVYFDLYFEWCFRTPTDTSFPVSGQGRTFIVTTSGAQPASRSLLMLSPVNVAVTADLPVALTYQWSSADSNNSLTVTNAFLQRIR